MLFKSYKSKLILTNLLIFAFLALLIFFIVLQGAWYYSVMNLKNDLLETATNLNLYIQEKTTNLESDDEKALYLFNNAGDIYNVVSNYSSCNIELFSYDGILLYYNDNKEPVNMNEEYQMSLNTEDPVMSIRNNNGIRELWVMVPIRTSSTVIIGFAGLTYPVTDADALNWFLFIIIALCILLGFFILILSVSNLSQRIVRPIQLLTRISSEINKGDYDKIIQYKKEDEIGDLTNVLNDMIQNTNGVITQLRSERQRYGNVLASLDDGLLAFDQDGKIIASNKYIKVYLGVVDPKTIQDFRYFDFIQDIFHALKEGKSNISEEVEVNGRILMLTGSPVISSNNLIKKEKVEDNYLIIIRNITTARNIEKEQRKFISSVSHELRTPLTTIIGYTDMLSRRKIDDPKLLSSSLETINREGHRLVRLVDDLLNANSLEKMTFSFEKVDISLDRLLRNVVEQMRIKSLQKDIEIIYKAEAGLPLIYGDYDRLSQVFINIIHNAIKFSSRGGIIDVVLTEEDEYLSVSIRDYGVGIDPAKKDFIFSAFYRVEEDRARHEGEGGAGLGLYLVKQIVDKHDGRITVESELEEGTNITVLLPFIDPNQKDKESDQ